MDKLEEKVEKIRNHLQELDTVLDDIDNITNDYEDKKTIKDTDNFIWKLSIDGRFNTNDVEKIKSFVEEYLKFYNK